MTIQELLTRLDTETDCLGDTLREMMQGDDSAVESITVDYELLEGGDEPWVADHPDMEYTPPTYVIKSFIVWTQDYVYHSESDEYAFLYEDGRVYRVPRHPEKNTQ